MPPNAAYGPYDAALSMFMHELKKYKKYLNFRIFDKKEHRNKLSCYNALLQMGSIVSNFYVNQK